MRLWFAPGELGLIKGDDGFYSVTIQHNEVSRSKSQKHALAKYMALRREMERRFPARELSQQEKAEMLSRTIGEALTGHNSLGGRKKRTTASSTRTFGG